MDKQMKAGRELDGLIAEEVMGLQVKQWRDGTWFMHTGTVGTELFHYSTNNGDAYQVAQQFIKGSPDRWEAFMNALVELEGAPALRVCLAALRVIDEVRY